VRLGLAAGPDRRSPVCLARLLSTPTGTRGDVPTGHIHAYLFAISQFSADKNLNSSAHFYPNSGSFTHAYRTSNVPSHRHLGPATHRNSRS
jgi:hypothetical protein